MENIALQDLIQIPLLLGFMWFMLKWQSNQHVANDKNQIMWQSWLEEQADKSKSERDEWREWLKARDVLYQRESRDVITVLQRLERRIDMSTNIILLIYETLSDSDTDIEQQMKKWQGILLNVE